MAQSRTPGIERFSPVFLTLDDPAVPPRLPRLPCEEQEALRAFFGLEADPFPEENDPSCYLGSTQHERCLERLRRGVEDGIVFGMVTARGGLGREFVTRLLKSTLSVAACRVLEVRIETGLTAKAFSKSLLHSLGFDWIYREEASLYNLLSLIKHTIRTAFQEKGIRLVLLLVEAQRSNLELWRVVKAISDMGNDRKTAVTILLFGEDRLREALQCPDLDSIRHRTFVRERLVPLTAPETGNYIRQRLDQVRYEGRLFSPAACAAIFSATAGIYRDVNTCAANALVRAFRRRERVIDLDWSAGGELPVGFC